MLKEIKSYFKENFELDLVFIQCGCFYEVYQEDATFLEDNKDFKYKTYKIIKNSIGKNVSFSKNFI